MVPVPSITPEHWDHRADLSEQAIMDRHASTVWAVPRTNLGVIAWPPTGRDKLFVRWHYWWQAHYLDCQVDAAERRCTGARITTINRTIRGMRVRNMGKFSRNNYYDDKAWLALALWRVEQLGGCSTKARHQLEVKDRRKELEENILAGVDSLTGVLPWRGQETFYNVPTNGPAAIMAARTGRLNLAAQLTDWVFDNLINEYGLVMDGLRMRMHGRENVTALYSYCQGVMLGACTELAVAQRAAEGVADQDLSDVGMRYITRTIGLVSAVHEEMANRLGVIDWTSSGGDGGLFNGILVRYLALVAEKLPEVGAAALQAKRLAKKMVLATAESAWRHRLEVDGLPVFPSNWAADAVLPQAGGLVGATIAGAVASSDIAERDLSVQLSGWMLMEAAARVSGVDLTAK
ncbi:glycoside hydrolase family 76 protein [Corynebacterium heidelbergense]|uniref:glycoside hydrolase family 76 protein n=1 Tax=Corynebacterium heidelbergense TaxID=2055947 RepID=UPI001EE721C5|nr:glycoside hydrolase family 76 protein [Corynebacterium heidelbergense]